jgi:hypothetical protein
MVERGTLNAEVAGSSPASPASEMVERVARALQQAHYARGRGLGPSWENIDRFEKEMWMFSARAAIDAIEQTGQSCGVCGCLVYPLPTKRDEAFK